MAFISDHLFSFTNKVKTDILTNLSVCTAEFIETGLTFSNEIGQLGRGGDLPRPGVQQGVAQGEQSWHCTSIDVSSIECIYSNQRGIKLTRSGSASGM
jgi:hypothetical protein